MAGSPLLLFVSDAAPKRSFADLLAQLQDPFVILGLLGQGLFFVRFLVQWVASERAGRSLVPIGFWYLSLAAALMVLVSGLFQWNLVLIVGQLPGFFVYARNLVLIHRERRGPPAVPAAASRMAGTPVG